MKFIKNIKKNFILSFPIIIGQIGQIIINTTDSIMIGKLGKHYLSAISLSNTIFIVFMVIGWGVSHAISPIISKFHKRKNNKSASHILYHCAIINIIFSILICLLIWFCSSLIIYLNQPPVVISLTIPFLKILILSITPYLLFEIGRKFCESIYLIYPGVIMTWIGVILNYFFNYIFIYGKLGCNKLGYIGSAYSSILSRILMLLGLFIIMIYNKQTSKYIFYIKKCKIKKKYILQLLKNGIPISLQLIFEMGAFVISSFIIGSINIEELIAHQVTVNIISITYIISLSLSIAGNIRISNQIAFKKYQDIQESGKSIIYLCSMFMLIIGLVLIIFSKKLPYIYITNIKIINITYKLIIASAFFQFFDGIQTVLLGLLRGMSDTQHSMWITFISYWIIGLPLSYILAIILNMKAIGIWIGLIIGLFTSCVLLIIRYINKINALINN